MALAAAACAFIDVPWPKLQFDRPYVAWIGDHGFYTLADAIEACHADDTIWVAPGPVFVDEPIPERLAIRGRWP